MSDFSLRTLQPYFPTQLVGILTLGLTMITVSLPSVTKENALQTESPVAAELQPSRLTAHLEMGPLTLNVGDLELQIAFYRDVVGLQELETARNEVLLGWEDRPVLRLVASDLPAFPRESAGLYHSAIVFTSRAELAQAVQRVLQQRPDLYSGTADHIVSEAFYFSDPEGNGLELYYDKDPNGWVWNNGRVQMGSEYIDPQQYLAIYLDEGGDATRKMGHVHLQVGNIAQAKSFYVDVLGMSVTAEMPTALFVSDGKYHHHLGMNTWESNGAGKRDETLGLRSFEMWVEKEEDLGGLRERLEQSKVEFVEEDGVITVQDPWGNVVRVDSYQQLSTFQ